MPESLLTILKFVLLALIWLFFIRVLRAAWAEMSGRRQIVVRQQVAAAAMPVAPRAPGPTNVTRIPSGATGASVTKGSGPQPAKGEMRLKIVEPAERRGRNFALGDELTVGRAGGCGVALPEDTFVSQLHARVFRRDGRIFLEDLGSTNGTFLNAKPVKSPVALSKGDRIQVGKTVLEVIK